ncbi:hypothetical protein AAD018_003600 [Aestuariibius insulae]|uniref:hypothetical protein n=1 Tax=Aestuariibius insulae TaxID=2058287 RepID=UPI00345E331A
MLKYLIFALFLPVAALADEPTIVAVDATQSGDSWRFDVTLEHPDTGWDHYADGWEVLAEDGTSLGLRVLHHPHENEQPFTRSLSGVVIPEGVTSVQIRARCNVDGWGEPIPFDLPVS